VDSNDLEFFILADNDTYIDIDNQLYSRGKLFSGSEKDVDIEDHTAVTNNLLPSLFSQYNVTLSGVTTTQASEHYNCSCQEHILFYCDF